MSVIFARTGMGSLAQAELHIASCFWPQVEDMFPARAHRHTETRRGHVQICGNNFTLNRFQGWPHPEGLSRLICARYIVMGGSGQSVFIGYLSGAIERPLKQSVCTFALYILFSLIEWMA